MSSKKGNINFIPAIIVLASMVILVLLGSVYAFQENTETIQGEADVTQYRVSSKVPGRLKRLLVSEGQYVYKGDTLAVLEAPDVMAKLEQAEAATAAAEAQNRKADAGARRQQVQAAYDMWQKAQVAVRITTQSYNRVKRLADEGVLPAQKLDEVTAKRDAAIQTEKAARSQYEMVKEGTRKEDKAAAAALVRRAQGAVSEVDSYVKEKYLVAAENGEVVNIYPVVGELLGPGAPIMSVAMMDNTWLTFNVREDYLKNFHMNKVVNVYIPALDKNIEAKVYYMQDIGSYAVWKVTKPTGSYDMKTFEVKLHPLEELKDLRPGMSIIYELPSQQ